MLKFGNTYLNFGGTYLSGWKAVPNYNPLNLPPNTVRVRTNDGNTPVKSNNTSYETATLVSGTTDVYDVYKSGTDFSDLLYDSTNVVEVLGANTTGITHMIGMFFGCSSLTTVQPFDTSNVVLMYSMFSDCTSLTSVPLFDTSITISMYSMFARCASLTSVPLLDTSSVSNMQSMFLECTSLTSVPLFDTSSVTNMNYMLYNCSSLTTVPLFNTSNVDRMDGMLSDCINVQSGALALYNQVSTQPTPPEGHNKVFYNCGINTETGSAELAQIPDDWK